MNRAMPVLIGTAFLVFALVALGGAVRDLLDEAWRPPFPIAMMAAAGVGLAVLAAFWLVLRRRPIRGLGMIAIAGAVLGLCVGIFGLAGTAQIMQERCSAPGSTAMLASSLPPGDCASALPSLLIGGYLIAIGIISVVSLAELARHGLGPDAALR